MSGGRAGKATTGLLPLTEDLASRLAGLAQQTLPAGAASEVTRLERLSGGNAREAWSFDLAWHEGVATQRRRCVALLQVAPGQLESDLGAEFAVIHALGGKGVRAPDAYWLDADGAALGCPGFVMERIEGETSLRTLLDPGHEASRAIALEMADAAAALHRLDVPGALRARFAGTPETVARQQVEEWEQLFLRHRMEPHPALAAAFGWLRAHTPRAARLSVVHGDFRFGNLVYRDGAVRALLDWEMAHLGDPCEDLAWAYRTLWGPAAHLPFEAFLRRYEDVGGPPVQPENLHFYRLFGEVKHAVISITGAHAYAAGNTPNLRLADRMAWVPECLEQFAAWCPGFGWGTAPR